MPGRRPRIGDVFEIALSDGRMAYGQYVQWNELMGPAIWVFDYLPEKTAEAGDILAAVGTAHILFGPVFTGLFAAIRTGLWRIVGHAEVRGLRPLRFLTVHDENYVPLGPWGLWDGESTRSLGRDLPSQYKHLELLIGWHPDSIRRRIETGENPYERMIKAG